MATDAYFGSGDLYSQSLAEVRGGSTATPAQAGPVTLSQTYNNSNAGDGFVTMPNTQWYYSAADAYSQNNPNSPYTGSWNYGMQKTQAEVAYQDDYFVTPGMRAWLDAVAHDIHPSSNGEGLWKDAVAASIAASQRGEYVTPYDLIQQRYGGYRIGVDTASSGGGYSSYGGGSYGGGGGSSSVSLASPSQAQALLTQYMQSTVGRDPKANEVRAFVELLQDYQMNNPSTVSMDGSTVVQSGGIDPNIVAKDYVETLPDYEEAQADKYYRTFMSALLGGGA